MRKRGKGDSIDRAFRRASGAGEFAPAGSGSRFVSVSADRLLGELTDIGKKIEAKGGGLIEHVIGREVVVDLVPSHGRCMVRVYTSLARGADAVRECGQDAIRVMVFVQTPEGTRLCEPPLKVLRTASMSSSDRVGAFLSRLRGILREEYGKARDNPSCPECGRCTALRTGRSGPFRGCVGYPQCRGTRSA